MSLMDNQKLVREQEEQFTDVKNVVSRVKYGQKWNNKISKIKSNKTTTQFGIGASMVNETTK